MNSGMRLARAELCIFLNADATPQGPEWLGSLVTALAQPNVAAVFSRQIPRPDCEMVFACDYERCFGPERESAKWEHFFSMVSSGIRKSVWALRGFREDLQYAEDDEYTRWCRAQGYIVQYVPDAIAMHSHNYTPDQAWKRSFGDARAIARAWPENLTVTWSAARTVVFGWLADLRHDARYAMRVRRFGELPHAMRIRWRQRTGKLAGYRAGYAETH
jgi:rhamnosyltransferase